MIKDYCRFFKIEIRSAHHMLFPHFACSKFKINQTEIILVRTILTQ